MDFRGRGQFGAPNLWIVHLFAARLRHQHKATAMMSMNALGPFKIAPSGLLSPATSALFPSFHVNWRQRAVQARMLQPNPDDETHGTLEIITRAGRIPSTGKPQSAPSDRRDIALGLLRGLSRLVPTGWTLRLAADHAVIMESRIALVLPISAIDLVTEISMFLLALNPYLDALEDGGAGAVTGIANT
jgi:hypothetical protein